MAISVVEGGGHSIAGYGAIDGGRSGRWPALDTVEDA
jgi:hypothetical protein